MQNNRIKIERDAFFVLIRMRRMSFLINKQRSVSENLVTRSQSEKRDQLYVLAVKTTNRTDYCQPRGNRERRECGREVRWRSEKRGDRYLTSGTLASGSHRFEK